MDVKNWQTKSQAKLNNIGGHYYQQILSSQ